MFFSKAKMIFPKGKNKDKHVFAGFYAELLYNGEENVSTAITAKTFYKLYVNGEFVWYGPCRSAHEYARVDTPDIKKYLKKGKNSIAVEVSGYCGQKTLEWTGEPAFLIAEICFDSMPVLYTGDGSWRAFLLTQKNLDVLPFSHARYSSEHYTLTPETNEWRISGKNSNECKIEILSDETKFIERRAENPDFSVIELKRAVFTKGIKKGVFTDEINVSEAEEESVIDFDFSVFRSGFIGIEFESEAPCSVTLCYPEKISREEGEFFTEPSGITAYTRPVTRLECSRGEISFETSEPYVARYMRITVKGTKAYKIKRLYVRLCQIKDLQGGGFLCGDGEINRLYKANRTSLLINTFDTFMDCAQRERGAGWNDDAYWTAPAARMMLGDLSVEKCYLENQIADTVKKYCDEPCACYPSDFRCIIPNWTVYILLELRDYYHRSGDKKLLTDNSDGIRFLVDSLNKYENKFGLLENVENIVYTSSNTVSCGNEPKAVFNQPISTMTNFMFADALSGLGEILDVPEWKEQAEKINAVIKRVADAIPDSFESGCFPPASIGMDEDGNPYPTGYDAEGITYFWLCSGLFGSEKHPKTVKRIVNQLGPKPKIKYSHDLFSVTRMGYEGDFFARLIALSKLGYQQKMIDEIKDFGLWALDNYGGLLSEGWDFYSSNHHIYNAFINYLLQREILGTDNADEVNRVISIAPHPCNISWAKGFITSNGGICSVKWHNDEEEFVISVDVPDGYTVEFTVPEDVTSRSRAYTLNGTQISVPADGIFKLENGFTFVSRKL